MRIFYFSFMVLLGAAAAFAGGFQTTDHSARSLGLGGACIAMPNDASSLYANPSVLSFVSGTHLSVGATILMPETRFTLAGNGGNTFKTQSQVLFPPNVSLSHTFEGGVGVGVLASVPFYFRNEWPADWMAGRTGTRSETRVVFISPTVSVKIVPSLSLGASFNIAFSHMQSSRRIGFEADVPAAPDGSQSLDGSGETSFGFSAGILFHPNDVWSFGAAYRSRMSIPVENGSITFAGIPNSLLESFPDGTYSTHITVPEHLSAGIGCTPFKALSLSGELQYVYWGALSSIDYTFGSAALTSNPAIDKSIPLHWKNALTARAGIELSLGVVSLRGGYTVEQSVVPDAYLRPSAPDASRRIYSGGIGYAVSEDLRLDFACSVAQYDDRSIRTSLVEYLPGAYLNGIYASSMTTIGINMSYSWN
jgi:long-chain fatty acid transport protein